MLYRVGVLVVLRIILRIVKICWGMLFCVCFFVVWKILGNSVEMFSMIIMKVMLYMVMMMRNYMMSLVVGSFGGIYMSVNVMMSGMMFRLIYGMW